MRANFVLTALLTGVLAACGGSTPETDTVPQAAPETEAQTVTIYSARHYDSDKALYAAFEDKTGITVQVREAKAPELLETLKAEGSSSPADVVIAADAGTLWRFKDAGLTQGVSSDALTTAIPARFREPDGHWFGLTKRARVIAYDPTRLSEEDVDSYRDLSEGRLRGEICMRSSSNIYNLSLLAELIERWGADEAGVWARGTVSNFARQPQGGDTTQIESIAAGECSAALVNHYYWVRLSESDSEDRRALTEATRLSFPEQDDAGTHVNVTAAAITANAPNADGAVKFIEFLATPEGQGMLVTETKEFPIVDGAAMPSGLEALPAFKESDMALSTLGENQSEAQRLYDRAGWN